MAKSRVLVLGNDPQINEIEFDRLAPDVITLGVNRIWLKHIPNYLFFNDWVIIDELNENPEILKEITQKTQVFSSDWLVQSDKRRLASVPSWVRVYFRDNPFVFPDSVSTALRLFTRHIKSSQDCVFYIAGVSLKWKEPSHFWKELNYPGKNSHGEEWYSSRFLKMENNLKALKNSGNYLVSVNPESRLNKFIRYTNIGNLYRKD
jgi:hypothetical protein